MANLGFAIVQVLFGSTLTFPTLGVVLGLALYGLGIMRKSR